MGPCKDKHFIAATIQPLCLRQIIDGESIYEFRDELTASIALLHV